MTTIYTHKYCEETIGDIEADICYEVNRLPANEDGFRKGNLVITVTIDFEPDEE